MEGKIGKFVDKGAYCMAEVLIKEEVVVKDILDTARVLFKQNGFKKTTMGDIAQRLGKAKSSLYYYYPGKEDIFEAVLRMEMDELLEQIHEVLREASSAKEKLILYCRCRLNKLSQLHYISEVLKSDVAELHCTMMDLKNRFDTSHVALVKEILEEGVHNGEFRPIDKKNLDLAADLLLSSFRGLAMPLMISRDRSPLGQEQIEFIVDLMISGIGQ